MTKYEASIAPNKGIYAVCFLYLHQVCISDFAI